MNPRPTIPTPIDGSGTTRLRPVEQSLHEVHAGTDVLDPRVAGLALEHEGRGKPPRGDDGEQRGPVDVAGPDRHLVAPFASHARPPGILEVQLPYVRRELLERGDGI